MNQFNIDKLLRRKLGKPEEGPDSDSRAYMEMLLKERARRSANVKRGYGLLIFFVVSGIVAAMVFRPWEVSKGNVGSVPGDNKSNMVNGVDSATKNEEVNAAVEKTQDPGSSAVSDSLERENSSVITNAGSGQVNSQPISKAAAVKKSADEKHVADQQKKNHDDTRKSAGDGDAAGLNHGHASKGKDKLNDQASSGSIRGDKSAEEKGDKLNEGTGIQVSTMHDFEDEEGQGVGLNTATDVTWEKAPAQKDMSGMDMVTTKQNEDSNGDSPKVDGVIGKTYAQGDTIPPSLTAVNRDSVEAAEKLLVPLSDNALSQILHPHFEVQLGYSWFSMSSTTGNHFYENSSEMKEALTGFAPDINISWAWNRMQAGIGYSFFKYENIPDEETIVVAHGQIVLNEVDELVLDAYNHTELDNKLKGYDAIVKLSRKNIPLSFGYQLLSPASHWGIMPRVGADIEFDSFTHMTYQRTAFHLEGVAQDTTYNWYEIWHTNQFDKYKDTFINGMAGIELRRRFGSHFYVAIEPGIKYSLWHHNKDIDNGFRQYNLRFAIGFALPGSCVVDCTEKCKD